MIAQLLAGVLFTLLGLLIHRQIAEAQGKRHLARVEQMRQEGKSVW